MTDHLMLARWDENDGGCLGQVTIYKTLLDRGYFPKELPPSFFTEQFARYATTKRGRRVISHYKPSDNFTECVTYQLALPGLNRRELRIPQPAAFATLATLTAKNFGRLIKKAGSPFAKSRPVYEIGKRRALRGAVKPSNLVNERAAARAGAAYLLKVDVSQFYPSLYTHAIGWAIDPQLRLRANWTKRNLLGKKLDQALMDLQGKVSQGIPVGNDISFLLAESVLAQVDRLLKWPRHRCVRWFDDYEISCDTREQAELLLARLTKELDSFGLRINSLKTAILTLPQSTQHEWQQSLLEYGKHPFTAPRDMVQFFDTAFRLRERFPDDPVLLYALGILFKLRCPSEQVGRVAVSALTQALLCESGAAQKAFALLTFWKLNGFVFDAELIVRTITQIILRHRAGGASSDVAWALSFCLDHRLVLPTAVGKVLSSLDDDCITIQALHAYAEGLLPRGFTTRRISRTLKDADMDGAHWLLAYEALRQGFMEESRAAVESNSLFSDLLACKVTFYRRKLPVYSSIVHSGGAPEWVVRTWLDSLRPGASPIPETSPDALPVLELIQQDATRLGQPEGTIDEIITNLMARFEKEEFSAILDNEEPYS